MTALRTSISPTMTRHPVSVDEFERMIEAGVFRPDAALELIDGEILEMSPIGDAHAAAVLYLTHHFSSLIPRAMVSVQNPFRLNEDSRPQPDLLLLKPRKDFYRKATPKPADMLLIVEVSDTTFRYDYEVKRPRYAKNGVRETWIVDLTESQIHVCRKPRNGAYTDEFVVEGEDRIAPLAFPEHLLTVRDLLG